MERDLSGFDKNVMELFDLCKDVLKSNEKRKLKGLDRGTPFLNRLDKYIKIYSKTEPSEHVGYFEKIFNDNKRMIMLGPQRDAWISDKDIIISYGEDYGLKTEMKFHISAIYFTSCRMRDEIKEENEGLPDTTDSVELGYPSRFLLFLYRIFREITPSDNEKTKLTVHVETLESSAGVRSSSSNPNDMLSGVFDMFEKASGTKIPRDKLPGKGTDITKMFGELLNDEKTKSMIGGVMSSLKDSKNAGDIVTKMIGALGSAGGNTPSAHVVHEQASQIEGSGGVNDEFADY